ncbi:MAG: signal recognition particle-docking protein FtsY [Candidatus Delongbacteria bacterium]|jgi:fused signal recognition particle receptor|nr:signal recognition particle-docking protein FtsY [Candidatus Delongbacteria bacterium]
MSLFRKKRIREYLREEKFLKEYRELLESRKGQHPSKTGKIDKASGADNTDKIIKQEKVEIAIKESYFDKLSRTLSKTKNSIVGKLNSIISKSSILDEDTLEDIEEALYTSDIGVKTTELIIEKLRERIQEEKSNENLDIKALIKQEIIELINKIPVNEIDYTEKPHVILVVGVNGNGKTTTIGKLAHYYQSQGKKVLIGAADTFRAAAIEQLETWATRTGSDFVKHQMGSDPAAVAFDSYKAGEARGMDVVLIDTAGRLHNKVNLMNELEKISRVLKKLNTNSPHEVLLVLDATTGQNALSQAKQFSLTSGVTGIVLTKLDGTAKGGVTIAINQEMDIPVKFIGLGEKKEDLEVFDPQEFVKTIFE